MGIKVWIALIGIFASFVLLVQGMGYVAFYLSPRDPDAIQRASEFEAVMGSLVRAPEDGVVAVVQAEGTRDLEAVMADVEIPNRHPEATGAVHRVAGMVGGTIWRSAYALPTGARRGSCRLYRNACRKILLLLYRRNSMGLMVGRGRGLPLVPAMWGLSKPGLRMKVWCDGMRWRRR